MKIGDIDYWFVDGKLYSNQYQPDDGEPMKVIENKGDWSLIINDKGTTLYIRHRCGQYLSREAFVKAGCYCNIKKVLKHGKGLPPEMWHKVDEAILKKFLLLAKGQHEEY